MRIHHPSFSCSRDHGCVCGATAFAESEFASKWPVQDSHGKSAVSGWHREGQSVRLKPGGTWKAMCNAVLISWDSELTTKITKQGNTFRKTLLQDGKPVGQPIEARKFGARTSPKGTP